MLPVSLHFFHTLALRLSQILLVRGHSSYVYFPHALFCPFARNFCSLFSSSSFTGLSPLRPVPQFLGMKQRTRFIFFLSACDNWRKDVQMLPLPKKSPHWVTRKLWSRALRFSTRPEGMILKPWIITSPHCFPFFYFVRSKKPFKDAISFHVVHMVGCDKGNFLENHCPIHLCTFVLLLPSLHSLSSILLAVPRWSEWSFFSN